MCMTGNGRRHGQKALVARCNITTESLPPLKSRHGRSNSAATSRMMWIDSASSISRWARPRVAVVIRLPRVPKPDPTSHIWIERSHEGQATIDDERVAGDIGRLGREKERGGRRHLPRRALTPERHRGA